MRKPIENHIHVHVDPSVPQRPQAGLGILFVVLALLFFLVWPGTGAQNAEPASAEMTPEDVLIESLEDHGAGASLYELVLPHYNLTLGTGESTAKVSLPLIQAKFAESFNRKIIQWVNSLYDNSKETAHQGNSMPLKSITYQAYLERDILTVLLRTEYHTGESEWEPWIFDLKQEGKLLEPWELAEAVVGMDYATFLWVTDRCVQNQFVDENWGQFRGVPEAEMSMAQLSEYENYIGILDQIPMDISNAFGRWVFPADGTVYLLYDLPILCDNWQYALTTKAGLMELDGTIFSLARTVTPKEAVADVVFASNVHNMGGSDQAHARLVRLAFYGAPEAFLEVVADLEGQEYAVESLLRYAGEADLQKIGEICTALRAGGDLTKEENAAAYLILTSIKAAS